MTQPRAGRPDASFDWQRREERWYAHYRNQLLAFCLTILHDRQIAEDVVHETFARALAQGLRFDRRSVPWLRTVAYNLCIDHVRRSARFAELAETEDRKAAEALERVDDAVDRSAQFAAVGAAFTALRARDRRVLWLRDIEGWDYPDIASADGSTARAVRARAHRARALLRSRLVAALARNLGIAVAVFRLRSRRLGQRTGWDGAYGLIAVSIVTSLSIAGLNLFFKPSGPALPATRSALSVTGRAQGADSSLEGGATAVTQGAQNTASARNPSLAGSSRPAGAADEVDKVNKAVYDFVDPMADATPENTYFEAIEPSPAFDSDRTIFAAGYHHCRVDWTTGCPVLFVTHDGGRRWHRLAAEGLIGWVHDLALPPAYPSDPRIFALDDAGLQESTDGGATFRLVSPFVQPLGGKLVVSPRFNDGDPRILIGGVGTVQIREYRADLRLTKPALFPIQFQDWHLQPTFSTNYAADELILVVGVQPLDHFVRFARGETGGRHIVYRCSPLQCDAIALGRFGNLPRIVLSPAFGKDGLGFVVVNSTLLRSRDGARTFVDIGLPPGETWNSSIAFRTSPSTDRPLVVASFGGWRTKGLYKSVDGGSMWIPIPANAARIVENDMGFRIVEIAGSNGPIIAARWSFGIVCSPDEGQTWAKRC